MNLTSKAICFGGDVCTATDIAVAAGICKGTYNIILLSNGTVLLINYTLSSVNSYIHVSNLL